MKRIDYILIGLLAISSLTACTEQKKSNIIIAPKPVAKVGHIPENCKKRDDGTWGLFPLDRTADRKQIIRVAF